MSRCVKVLKEHGGDTSSQLRNCIMYATKHFNEDTTPSNIRRALQA
jgi:CYRIA/CYRIB Rac1 binding domain